MNGRALMGLLSVAAVVVAVSCSTSSSGQARTGGKPLIAEPTTGVTFSNDFNPYDPNSVASSMGTRSLVNEPLVEFDQLDPTSAGTHPRPASGVTFPNGGQDPRGTVPTGGRCNDR